MKAFILLLSLCVSLTSFAQELSIYESLKKLNRVVKLTVDGKALDFGFKDGGGMEAFYAGPGYENEIAMRVEGDYTKANLKVEIMIDDTVYSFPLESGLVTGTFKANKITIKKIQERFTDNESHMWNDYKTVKKLGTVDVVVKTPFNGSKYINQVVTVTGPLKFNPCDGCEHGDQMMIKTTNVVNSTSFGSYYIEGCEGEVFPLLMQLFAHELSVPFTYKGLINMDVKDYYEDVGSMWMGTKAGQIFVGPTTKLPLSRFLDSLVVRTAVLLKLESHKIWDDVVKNGKFIGYANDVLTFQYKSAIIKTNLKTATTL